MKKVTKCQEEKKTG